jgi:hypothetical protein
VLNTNSPDRREATATVIPLTQETLSVTELTPDGGVFIGKSIQRDGSITQYPKVTWWRQQVAQVQATVFGVHEYLREARMRNVCLIRGAPANIERQPTRRQRAHEVHHGKDRGDHGFIDEPARLFFLDIDGVEIKWRAEPERAIRTIVAELGEPWASTSFCWFFSATHGLELDEQKRWTGKISHGKLRVRIAFITTRALNESEASELTALAKAKLPKIDPCVSRLVQPNYILRPQWRDFLERDPLGDIPTIGWVRGAHDYLAVPDDLTHKARWAKAQGHQVDIASHPDAETAVRSIGSDGRIRGHLLAAVEHLLHANPPPEVVSFADHSIAIVDELQEMLEQHRSEIENNLAAYGRYWAEVLGYFAGMADWCQWLLDHPEALHRKTIKLVKEDKAKPDATVTREAIFTRVERTIERACFEEEDPFEKCGNEVLDTAPVELLIAPPGSRKSTWLRKTAVRYVTEHPDRSVCIFMPRHRLGDEQIRLMQEEHPDANFSAAIWRGRQALDPDGRDGERMCQRPEDTKAVQDAMLDVEHSCCKQGRGSKTIKCPLYDGCAWQGQKQIEANVWFMAHEMLTQAPLKVFGKVGLVMIDESPLDAFIFGVDYNDQSVLGLDVLRQPPPNNDTVVMDGREALYHALHPLRVPISRHLGMPPSRAHLHAFIDRRGTKERAIHIAEHDANDLHKREFRNKVVPEITPTMTKKQIAEKLEEAAGNSIVRRCTMLFKLISQFNEAEEIERYGRIQVQRGEKGREIRMVGLRAMGKGWSSVRTLICDATGDPELLRTIWPNLVCEEEHTWQQLPRAKSVRIFQMVDRSLSKYVVAIEGNKEEVEPPPWSCAGTAPPWIRSWRAREQPCAPR